MSEGGRGGKSGARKKRFLCRGGQLAPLRLWLSPPVIGRSVAPPADWPLTGPTFRYGKTANPKFYRGVKKDTVGVDFDFDNGKSLVTAVKERQGYKFGKHPIHMFYCMEQPLLDAMGGDAKADPGAG